MGGCFVDLLVPLAHGTDLHLRITKEDRTFEKEARAVYTYPSMGNGIAFTGVTAQNQTIL
jgi:hypothetical protein